MIMHVVTQTKLASERNARPWKTGGGGMVAAELQVCGGEVELAHRDLLAPLRLKLRRPDSCRLVPNRSAVVDGIACPDATLAQPCFWEQDPHLIGQNVAVLPSAPVEVDFPFACQAGLLG